MIREEGDILLRKDTPLNAAIAICAILLTLVIAVIMLNPTIDTLELGPTRFFEFRIRDTNDKNISNVTVDIEWEKGGGRRGMSFQEVDYRADGSVAVKWTTAGVGAPPPEPVALVFTISKIEYKQQERVFAIEELDQEYYVRTQDDTRVYHLPDFVLERDEE